MQHECDEDYPDGPHTYLNIDTYTDQLLNDIGLPTDPEYERDKKSSVVEAPHINSFVLALQSLWDFLNMSQSNSGIHTFEQGSLMLATSIAGSSMFIM